MPRFLSGSLSLRISVTLALVLTIILVVFIFVATNMLRADLFGTRRETILADASVRFSQAQNALDQSTAVTTNQVQDAVTQVLTTIRESAAGAGAVDVLLMRSPQSSEVFRINEYRNPDYADAINSEMRTGLAHDMGLWQSVALPTETGVVPGIVVGALIDIPTAGPYEMYVIYSLAQEQSTLESIIKVLTIGSVPVLILMGMVSFILVYRLLAPVRDAAVAARALAAGDLTSRVRVAGRDEMAQLGATFNDMAESLQSKITDYDTLSKFQQGFVSDVSHELRTPMTTIRMADEIIFDDRDALPPASKRSAELLHVEVSRFEQMLADLLEISRYDAQSANFDAEMTDLYSLVEKVVNANSELADHLGVKLVLGPRPERCSVPLDPIRMERVVRNLLVNACEYADGNPVELTVASGETSVAFRVRDRGVGMSPDTVKRVFDRFYRANPARTRTTGGTGLGLAISREDVILHNGVINAWGELGKGSSFVVTLPRVAGSAVTEFPLMVWEDE
ncbi:MtrAB system histidine kinase MtrB [Actinomyces minihominis]|uniref:MtrAB system histidine kinase MtrB n=1 Tax=Actinomyces minihominis TaxID=2002838 RepID=UPI001F5C7E19|nr:MtrAB system histidine kinase MtrB [Actinomyces minihominis]